MVSESASSSVVIKVSDTGCGIPAEQIDQIFDPFFTTTRDWRGTGLGLAVSFRIVQLLKGTISVSSQVGKGTVFTVTLPATF
jgi:signal transduction histidine kinase